MLKIGIIGLPNVGKSTLFNALTHGRAEANPYPFTTIDSNVGMAALADPRLEEIAACTGAEKVIPAPVKFVDIAGLVKGAHDGEGLGNQFLGHIREVDAIAHLVRCFSDANVAHVEAGVDPVRDIETVELELLFADQETVARRLEKERKASKSGDRQTVAGAEFLAGLLEKLEKGTPARMIEVPGQQSELFRSLWLLTAKPGIYVANLSEDDLPEDESELFAKVKRKAGEQGAEAVGISAKIEEEITELAPEEAADFLADLGEDEPGLARLVHTCYKLLGLITFFTIESGHAQAWPLPEGSNAAQAAGQIHGDMETGFIKADVINYSHLTEAGSFAAAREQGHLMVEGREYIVKDGDVLRIKFKA